MADELLTLGASSGTDVRNTVYEEHTVSGRIVTFSDGADDVPLKKCEITLPASLDGYSSVDVVHCGKNLFDKDNPNEVDGYIDVSSFNTNNVRAKTIYIPIKGGATYTVSKTVGARFSIATAGVIPSNGATYTSRQAGNTSASLTITASASDKYLWAWVYLENTDTISLADMLASVQIEVGSATTYEPYEAPTTHTAFLGRTIYGGSVDVVKGPGESLCGKIVFDGSESRWSAYTTGNGYSIPLSGMKRGTWYTSDLALSYPLPKAPNNDNLGVRIGVNNDGIYVVQANTIEGVTDLESFKAYLAENPLTVIYPLDDSETFTFDPVPIDSKLGNNTIWSEQGTNVEVTYYSEREVINNYNVTATQLTAIADAIREKKQSTAPILFEDFPNEILTIETGGGGEDAVTWVFTAWGNADNYYYTAQEDGLYLALAVRNQSTGCSISLPDGGDVVLTSTLLSPKFQMKVVRLTAGQRIQLGIYNSSHVRGGWVFKLNVTPTAIAYTRAVDQYGTYNMVNQGTSNMVLSILVTYYGNAFSGWDPTMECFILSPLNGSANIRIMYGVDMTMPAISYGGPSTAQWILNTQED